MKNFIIGFIHGLFKARVASRFTVVLTIIVLGGFAGKINAGSLETGSLDSGHTGTSLEKTLRIQGLVMQTLTDGLVIHCAVPGATSASGPHVYSDVYVKGAAGSFGYVDLPVLEAGTFSYKDKTGKVKTVRAYELKKPLK